MAIENMARKIKELRQAKGLTLEQVATVVGVGKSTVRKWETGMIANMKRDKIAALAKALGTTPAYLMGWEEDTTTKALPNESANLTDEEQKWLELFRQLPESSQSAALLLFDLFEKVPEENQQMVLGMIQVALRKK